MNKVVIDMTISLDGFVAGPDDGPQYPLGKNGGMAIFDRKTYDITNGWNGRHPVNGARLHPDPQPAAGKLAKAAAGGVPLFNILDHGIRLEKIHMSDGPLATHIRYRVLN
jgi:hypothetical protein